MTTAYDHRQWGFCSDAIQVGNAGVSNRPTIARGVYELASPHHTNVRTHCLVRWFIVLFYRNGRNMFFCPPAHH